MGYERQIDLNTLRGLGRYSTNIVEYGANSIIGSLSAKVKDTFGKEYYFTNSEGGFDIVKTVTDKFIKKYDKNFDAHINEIKGTIENKIFLCTLDKNTYMVVMTGDKILGSFDFNRTDLYLYIFGKKTIMYCKRLERIINNCKNTNNLGIYNVSADNRRGYGREDEDSKSLDITYMPMNIRSMDSIFFSNNEKQQVINHIDKFNNIKDLYTSKEIIYKTGILLYGNPGEGKTSFVKAIAGMYNRSIININVAELKHIDLIKLTQSINYDTDVQYIVLLEDVDTLFLNRTDENTDKDDNAVINQLLQFLDSNTSPNNVIFIATTNHKERLDEALLREGRFDLHVNIHGLKDKDAIEFCKSFGLSEKAAQEVVDQIKIDKDCSDGINQSALQARTLAKLENKDLSMIVNRVGEEIDSSIKIIEEETKKKDEQKENEDNEEW